MRTPNLDYYVAVYAAVERIVLRSGCGAATVRAVATEGGLSPSTVRHYYRNQSHLLACAFAVVMDHFVAEVDRRPPVAHRGGRLRVEEAVDVLTAHLPTHGHALERLRLLHAYKSWARHDWDMAITVAAFDERLLRLCVRVCLRVGLPPVQARRQARVLRALLTGLAEEIVTLADPPEGQRDLGLPDRLTDRGVRTVLTAHLDAMLARPELACPEQARSTAQVNDR